MMKIVSLVRTRLIHISSSYWKSYRSFEIILVMGTFDWIGIEIQCSVQFVASEILSI